MQLIFVRGNSPLGLAICALTWSTWSHVAIAAGDKVIHATAKHGVVRGSRADLLAAFDKYLVVDVITPDDAAGLRFAVEQLGKPYDWTAIGGFATPWRRWQEPGRWFCSELAAGALQAAGGVVPEDAWRITPARLRDLTRPV